MRKNILSGIYCIENLINNKKYIGQSKNINDRWSKHKNELNKNIHSNDYLQKSWNKYGEENFKFYVLEVCDESELDEKEIYYIELYNTLNRDLGYNLKSGGQNGSKITEYVRQKQSDALKQSYKNNEDLKLQRKNDALKQWSNPEIKQKIMGENNGMYGKHHTEETRQKISEAHKGRISTKRISIPVLCIELNKLFQDAATAAKELSCQSGSILQACRGKRKTCAGYHWQFITENNIG